MACTKLNMYLLILGACTVGYSNRSVRVSVSLLPWNLLPIPLLCWKDRRCHRVFECFKVFVVRLLLKIPHSRVLVSSSLLVTATFLAPWQAFDGQRSFFFNSRGMYMCMVSDRSNKTTGSSLIVAHWQISFLAFWACYKLLTRHCCMTNVILLHNTQSHAMWLPWLQVFK